MSNIRNRAAEIALTESKRSDTSEVIDNRSPRIDEYLKLAGLLPADPATIGKAWCGAFVYWCYQQASKEFDGKNPLPRETFGGRPLKTWAEAHKDWIIYQAGGAEPALESGDIFVVLDLSHVGMVSKPIEDYTKDGSTHRAFTSVEGNQMDSQFPNWGNKGIRVKRVEVSRCAVIIRPPDLAQTGG
jgi:hypothetical protein